MENFSKAELESFLDQHQKPFDEAQQEAARAFQGSGNNMGQFMQQIANNTNAVVHKQFIQALRGNYINPSRKDKRVPWVILAISGTAALGFSAYSIYALFEEGVELNQEISWIDGVISPIASLIALYLYMQYYRTMPTADYEKDGASLRNISKLDAARILVPMLIIVAPNLLLLDPIIEALGPDYIYAQLAKHIFYILSTTAAIGMAVYMQKLEESEIIQYFILPSIVALNANLVPPMAHGSSRQLLTAIEREFGKMDILQELQKPQPTPLDNTKYYEEVAEFPADKAEMLSETLSNEFQMHVLEMPGFILLHKGCDLTYAPSMKVFSNALFRAVKAHKHLLIECELTNEMLDLIMQINSEFSQQIVQKGNEFADEGENNDAYTSMPTQIVKYCFGDNKFNCDNRKATWTRPYITGNGGQSKCVTDKHEGDAFNRTPSHYQDSVIAIPTVNIETNPMRTAGATKAKDMVRPLTELAQFPGTHVIPVKLNLTPEQRQNIFSKDHKITVMPEHLPIIFNIDAGERPIGYVERLQQQDLQIVFNNISRQRLVQNVSENGFGVQ